MLLDRFVVWIGMLVKRFRRHHDEPGVRRPRRRRLPQKRLLHAASCCERHRPRALERNHSSTRTRRAGAEWVLRLTMMARRAAPGFAAAQRAPTAAAARVIAPP